MKVINGTYVAKDLLTACVSIHVSVVNSVVVIGLSVALSAEITVSDNAYRIGIDVG